MLKNFLYSSVWCIVFSILMVSCNEEEPEPIVIKAEIPASVKLKNTFSDQDTLKFHIFSEAKIDSIRLFEGANNYVSLGTGNIGSVREFKLYFLYNPSSPGIKNLKLNVIAAPFKEDYFFSILVEE